MATKVNLRGMGLGGFAFLTDKTERNSVIIKVSGDIKPVGPAIPGNGTAPITPQPGVK